jgi:hypothetical protein
MRTDELIAILAGATTPTPRGRARQRLLLACAVGLLGAALLVFGSHILPAKHDFSTVILTAPFWMKPAYAAWLAVGAFMLVDAMGRPGAKPDAGRLVAAAAFAAIAGLAAVNLVLTAPEHRMQAIMGSSWWFCPIAIVISAIPALIAVMIALRNMAPTQLVRAGLAAGLLAGGVGASVYALWCRETTAAFVAVWYTIGIVACGGVGALLGPLVLRW